MILLVIRLKIPIMYSNLGLSLLFCELLYLFVFFFLAFLDPYPVVSNSQSIVILCSRILSSIERSDLQGFKDTIQITDDLETL